jgi:hypothetical protein
MTSFFSASASSGAIFTIRASENRARAQALICASIRTTLEAISEVTFAAGATGANKTATSLTGDAAYLCDFVASTINTLVDLVFTLRERKKAKPAVPDVRGPEDDPLFSATADFTSSSAVWRSTDDYPAGSMLSFLLSLFLSINKVLRDAAAGYAAYDKSETADEKNDKLNETQRISSKVRVGGTQGLKLASDLLQLTGLFGVAANPSKRPASGFHISSKDSYLAMVSGGHGGFHCNGAVFIESGGENPLASDLRRYSVRAGSEWRKLLVDSAMKPPERGLRDTSAVLLRGELVSFMGGQDALLDAREGMEIWSKTQVRIATGEGPARPAVSPAPYVKAAKEDVAVVPDGPPLAQGISLEALADGGKVRMLCAPEAGALLLLHGPHSGPNAAPGAGTQGGRRLELSSDGVTLQNDQDLGLRINGEKGATLKASSTVSLELDKPGGAVKMSAGQGNTMSISASKFEIAVQNKVAMAGQIANLDMDVSSARLKTEGTVQVPVKLGSQLG